MSMKLQQAIEADKDGKEFPAGFYVRMPYDRDRVSTVFEGESMTHQSHAESCDINAVINRYMDTGFLPPGMDGGVYADVTELQGDLTDLINRSKAVIADADAKAAELVAKRAAEAEQQRVAEAVAAATAAKPAADESNGS